MRPDLNLNFISHKHTHTMKTKKFLPVAITCIAISGLLITGCKKDEEDAVDTTVQTEMQDRAMADASYDDVLAVSDEAAALKTGAISETDRSTTTCATISIDTVTVPHILIIDFGPTDCLCGDGNYRRGIIHVEWTGHYNDAGHVHTITFDNYFVNFNQVTGTKTVENIGLNANGNPEFHVTVNGSVIFDAQYGGGTITYVSDRTREWIAGSTTLAILDDIYLISGTGSGTNRDGIAYSMQTTVDLRKEIGWPHFTSGILEFTPSGKPTRSIDFSYLNNSRDNLAQVTVNGQTKTIVLRGRKP